MLEILAEWRVHGARDVTGDGIDGLRFTAETRLATDVDYFPLRVEPQLINGIHVDSWPMPGIGRVVVACHRGGDRRGHVQSLGEGRAEAAVQDANAGVAGAAQHPPRPRRGVRAVMIVVHHDVRFRADAPRSEALGPALDGGERMTAAARRIEAFLARGAQLRIE